MSRITTEPHWDKRENNKRKRFVFWPIETKWWNWWRILILTKRKASQYPVGHDRPVLVSCNGCSPTSTSAFPPTRPTAWSPAMPAPRKPISTLSSERPLWCRRHHADSLLDYICLPDCCTVLVCLSGNGWDAVGEGSCIVGNRKLLHVCIFPTLLLLLLVKGQQTHNRQQANWPAVKEHKNAMLNVGIFL